MANEFKAKNGLLAPYAGVVYVDLDTNTAATPARARVWYNTEDDTLNIGHDNGVVQQVGQEFFMPPCKNTSGVTIPNGSFVMATGAQGDKITIAAAVTNGTVAPEYMIGVASRDITTGDEFAQIVTNGIVRDINTSAWAVGTILYPNPAVAGGWTNTKPTAPSIKTPVAIVLRQHANTGRIYVRMSNGSVLGGTDSNVEFGTLANNDLIVYNTTTGRWENKQPSEVPGVSGVSGYSGFSGYSGAQGQSGTSGYSGYSGQSGTQGESGISGYSGYSGAQGDSGISGVSGFSGTSGYSGASGISGYSGQNGASGISGYSGAQGASGISGYSGSGISGYSGFSGYSGAQGTAGVAQTTTISDSAPSNPVNGDIWWKSDEGALKIYYSDADSSQWVDAWPTLVGDSGFSGYSGISGYSGRSGWSGISGYSGSGISGYSGWSGISGYSGSGISGYSGTSGISGYSGWSGISGYSGSGISGYSGYSGTSGFSGISGYSGSGISGYSGWSGLSGYSGLSTRYLQIIAVEKSTTLTNATDIIGQVEIPTNGTITNLRAKTTTGTATVTFKINGSSIGSVNATTSGVSSSVSSAISAYDDLTLDVSSASGNGLLVTLTIA